MGVGGQRHAPATFPPGKTRYSLYSRLCGPKGRSGRVRKISPPPGFDPWTVQPVATRYNDWATPAHFTTNVACNHNCKHYLLMQQNRLGLINSFYRTCLKLRPARNNTDSKGQFYLDIK